MHSTSDELYFLSGGGDMGKLIRATDWSKTSLGDPHSWPQSLKTMVSVILNNPFGMYIAWGDEFTQIYNDGYRPILGSGKHPAALGISTRETFQEIWHIIGSMFDGVMKGKAVGFPDFMLPLNRNGFVEECYFDFSYSPIYREDGVVGGVLVTVIETTEKRKAIDAFKEGEARFRTMADNISQLAWMTDEKGWIFWYNQRWFEYTGTTLEEMQGWGWQKVHHPDYVNGVVERFTAALEQAEEWEDTFPLLGIDGNYRWFLSRAVPIKDHKGQVIRWFGTNTDITERMQSEQSYKESEYRFRTMAEATDVLIATSDETSRATYFNTAWTDLTGRSPEDLLRLGWVDLIHADDRQSFMDVYLSAIHQQQPWAGEFRLSDNIGGYRWLLSKGQPRFRPDGSFAGYISSGIDITERKEAEKRVRDSEQNLRNTILQAPVAMCFLKGEALIVELANERMIELWGKSTRGVIGQPLFEAVPEASGQGFEGLLANVLNTGETFSAQGIPVTLPRAGKLETVYVNFVYAPYKEPNGNISGVLAIAIDVTAQVIARQQIEEVVASRTKELAEANQSLQRSNAELAQFAYIASHDLQEPLRKVSTFAEMLGHSLTDIDDRSRNYLGKINAATARMLTLIRDVLAYSRLSKESEIFEAVDLEKIIDTVKNDFELMIEQKGAVINVKQLPTIEAIPLQMSQLFGNLVSNALKFARAEVLPEITISASIWEGGGPINQFEADAGMQYYHIICGDNGIGFDQAYADQIFNIFQRLHGRASYSGTGIGLAMCKKIVQNHYGAIWAESHGQGGALFHLILPARHKPPSV